MLKKSIFSHSFLVSCLCLMTAALFMSFSAISYAGSAIRAVVNDEPITSYDVEQRAKFMKLAMRRPLNNALRKAALEELIDEKLKTQMARLSGISIDRNAAEQQFAAVARNSKLSIKEFEAILRKSGVQPDTFKTRLAVAATWEEIVRSRFERDIGSRREELQERIEDISDAEQKTAETEYQLAQLIIVAPKGDKAAQAQAERTIKATRKSYENCGELKAEAKKHQTAIYKFIGWRRETELPEASVVRLAALNVGELSKTERSPNGFDLAMICQKRSVEITGIIIDKGAEQNVLNDEFETLARRMIRDMRQEATISYR